MRFRERRVTSQDNLALYLRDYGDPLSSDPPVLCLGGLTRNSKDFHALATRFAPDRRVICPDYRGRGQSEYDREWRNYVPVTYIDDVFHVLSALNIHKVIVIGTSLGGLLAMGLATRMPSAIAGVVLNDIGPEIEAQGLSAIIEYIRADRPQPDLEAAAKLLKQMLPNLSRRDHRIWRKMAENTFRTGTDGLLHFDWDPSIVRPFLSNPEIPDLWPFFSALKKVPTLAIRGEISDLLTAGCFDRMAQAKPDLIRITVPDTGHAPTLDEPEVQEPLDDFIASI